MRCLLDKVALISCFLIMFSQGDLYDHDSLVKAIKDVDVVISAVGFGQLADQTKIIAAIKEAGNIKVIKSLNPALVFCY